VTRDVVGGLTQDTFTKEPRQGEIDNIHIAPRLRLVKVKKVKAKGILMSSIVDVDRKALGLDEIVMAPFCAHDCLHVHWRWGLTATKRSNLGWDSAGPYRAAGAPMVPENQNVWVQFRSDHEMTYHVVAGNSDGDLLYPYSWQVFMHHGFAHAVAISDHITMAAAQFGVSALSDTQFYPTDDATDATALRVSQSTAFFYWILRQEAKLVNGVATARERILYGEDGLEKALDL
jgi:hypothetical protein